ncbi:MAG: rhodanese-like domain-containing protein [Verrucomicrobiota bacterium]
MPRLHHPALLLLASLLIACSPPDAEEIRTEPPAVKLPASVKQLAPDEAAALIQSTPNLVILDLREDWELKKQGRIANSRWADFLNDERFSAATTKLSVDQPTLLYCAIGGRSKLAAEKLTAKGFTQLFVLDGGLEAWLASGKPVQK